MSHRAPPSPKPPVAGFPNRGVRRAITHAQLRGCYVRLDNDTGAWTVTDRAPVLTDEHGQFMRRRYARKLIAADRDSDEKRPFKPTDGPLA